MDNAARWFLAGIVISLINTGLVIVFIGIPGVTDNGNDTASAAAPAETRTFVLVVDEEGHVVAQRTELGAPSDGIPDTATTEGDSGEAMSGALLGLGEPQFARIERPSFLSAHDGQAYVATQRFELQRVDLDGDVASESLGGVEDLGGSRIVDVDVTTDGALYTLVVDGTLDWRLFRRGAGGGDWELATSSDEVGWPASVVALSVTDAGAVYLSASDPAGVARIEPDMVTVRQWVSAGTVLGLDTANDDSRLLFVEPVPLPEEPARQVQQVREGRVSSWLSTYTACGPPGEAAAETTPAVLVPQLPRDVAVVDNRDDGADTALVVDSLNHVVWYQTHFGTGEAVFGVGCQRGTDDAHLNTPRGVAMDEDGNVFIADTGNGRVVVLPHTGPAGE